MTEDYRDTTLDILKRPGKSGIPEMAKLLRAEMIRRLEAGEPVQGRCSVSIPALRVNEPAIVLTLAIESEQGS